MAGETLASQATVEPNSLPSAPPSVDDRWPELWRELKTEIETETGMNLDGDREYRLRFALRETMRQEGLASPAQLGSRLRQPARRAAILGRLVTALTVGETFFFRNADHFQALRERVLPELIARGERPLQFWCAGCATGEEPYSLVILLARDFPALPAAEVEILATDRDQRFLAQAAQGRYRPWSFRGTEVQHDPRYFRRAGERFELASGLRQRVRFRQHHLVRDVYPTGFDLIIFRNVAIYLRPEVIRAIIRNLAASLKPGGWLLLGEAETRGDLWRSEDFAPVMHGGALLLRRHGGAIAEPQPAQPLAMLPLAPMMDTGIARDIVGATHASPLPVAPLTLDLTLLDDPGVGPTPAPVAPLPVAIEAPAPAKTDGPDPLDATRHLRDALRAEEAGDDAAAEAALRRALYLEPDAPMPHFLLGLLMSRAGRRAEMRRALANARELTERHSPETELAYGDGLLAGRLLALIAELEPEA